MDIWTTLLDIVALLGAALLLGLICERLRQSAIVGYLMAGMVLGPGALAVIRHEAVIRQLAELGVALLLFSIGLEFSWRRLKRLGAVALGGGVFQIVLTAGAVATGCLLFGMSSATAVAIGLIVAPSSTACVLRILRDRAELDSIHGRASLGILLLQDAALIPLVIILTTLGGNESGGVVAGKLLLNLALALVLFGVMYLLANHVLPRVLDAAIVARHRETPILLAVTTCLAASWGAHALGLSPALGSFAAGFLLAESPYATGIRADVSALRTVFVTLFFASIGMLADVPWMLGHIPLLVVATSTVLIGKAALCWVATILFKLPFHYAAATGLCLAQIGEFSFVLAGVAETRGLLTPDAFRIIIATTVATLLMTPYLVSVSPRLSQWLLFRLSPESDARKRAQCAGDETHAQQLVDHVVLVGYGPAGKEIVKALQREGIPLAVVDLNQRAIAAATATGLVAQVGDATQAEVLEEVRASKALACVVTVPDRFTALQVRDQLRLTAPHVPIFARARYHIHSGELADRGAIVVDEEQEIGRAMGRAIVTRLASSTKPE